MSKNRDKQIEEVFGRDGRYPLASVQFVREGLNHTIDRVYEAEEGGAARRHVSGRQLCLGLRDLARKRWGYMAPGVLRHWNIHSTRDFGEIVFLLVEHGWMHKEPTDSLDDFNDVFDFDEAFERQFSFDDHEDGGRG